MVVQQVEDFAGVDLVHGHGHSEVTLVFLKISDTFLE